MPGFFDVECLLIDEPLAFLKLLVRFSMFELNRDEFKGANLVVGHLQQSAAESERVNEQAAKQADLDRLMDELEVLINQEADTNMEMQELLDLIKTQDEALIQASSGTQLKKKFAAVQKKSNLEKCRQRRRS